MTIETAIYIESDLVNIVTYWHSWLLLTNCKTWVMTLRVRDLQSYSDLDSIRNSCDASFQNRDWQVKTRLLLFKCNTDQVHVWERQIQIQGQTQIQIRRQTQMLGNWLPSAPVLSCKQWWPECRNVEPLCSAPPSDLHVNSPPAIQPVPNKPKTMPLPWTQIS